MMLQGLVIAIMLISNGLPSQGSPIFCTSTGDEAHDPSSHTDETPQAGCTGQPNSSYGLSMTCSACGGTVLMEQFSLPPMTASALTVEHQSKISTVLPTSIWHPPV